MSLNKILSLCDYIPKSLKSFSFSNNKERPVISFYTKFLTCFFNSKFFNISPTSSLLQSLTDFLHLI